MVVTIIASPPGAHKRLGQCRAFSNAEPASVESARFFASLRDPIVYRGDIILHSVQPLLKQALVHRITVLVERTVAQRCLNNVATYICPHPLNSSKKIYEKSARFLHQ